MPKENSSAESAASESAPKQATIILAAAALMAIEALAIGYVLVQWAVAVFSGSFESLQSILFEGVLAAIAIVWIVATIVGLLRHSSWARSSAVVIQLMVIAFGFSLIGSGAAGELLFLSITAVLIGGATLAILFTKQAGELLSHR